MVSNRSIAILSTLAFLTLQSALYNFWPAYVKTSHSPHIVKNEFVKDVVEDLKKEKTILYFTSYFHMADWQFGFGQKPFILHDCPVTNCYATNNKSLLGSFADFDAIMFNIRDMSNGNIALPNQKKRRSLQKYVMFLMESPLNDGFPYNKFANYFNWTMTYRQDSDFPRPYGWVAPKNASWHSPPKKPFDLTYPLASNVVIKPERKRKLESKKGIAWLVSNCHTHSQREHYVKNMSQLIHVDIYGKCGKHTCPTDDTRCMDHISDSYMFYLSFENSKCKDYVTEKFFKALAADIVPVVLGGADYAKIAPAKSYINVADYESPEDLATYLNYVSNNLTAYEEYFAWKQYFTVYNDATRFSSRAMCEMCKALNNDTAAAKSYDDMDDWWRNGGQCKAKGTFPWSMIEDPWFSFALKNAKDIMGTLHGAGVVV